MGEDNEPGMGEDNEPGMGEGEYGKGITHEYKTEYATKSSILVSIILVHVIFSTGYVLPSIHTSTGYVLPSMARTTGSDLLGRHKAC
jgi:hypothetical protein